MSQTLYRKYRPGLFSEVVGQDHITVTLRNQIKHDQISHAYLFTGPRGVGKTTTARLLAQAAQAHDEATGEPDTSMGIVTAMREGKSLDLVEIDAASNRRIEEVRELREHVKYPPNEARYKVFIIDEVHMLTTEAFNALLKTLEEPPSYVIFILATTELHKLPDTIISRCQRFDFKPVKPRELFERLQYLCNQEKKQVDESVMHTVIRMSGGSVRDAESTLAQVLSLGKDTITEEDAQIFLPQAQTEAISSLWQHMIKGNAADGLKVLQKLIDQSIDFGFFYDEWLEVLRQALLIKVKAVEGNDAVILEEELVAVLTKSLAEISPTDCVFCLDTFIQHKQYMSTTPVEYLPFEIAYVLCCEHFSKDNTGSSVPKQGKKIAQSDTNEQVKPPAESSMDSAVSERTIQKKWKKVVASLTEKNPGLGHYLQDVAVRLNGNSLELIITHVFHYEIIKKQNHLDSIQKDWQRHFGQILAIVPQFIEEKNKDQSAASNTGPVNQLADAFGGSVMN